MAIDNRFSPNTAKSNATKRLSSSRRLKQPNNSKIGSREPSERDIISQDNNNGISNPPESCLAEKQRKAVPYKAEAESIWVLGLDDYSNPPERCLAKKQRKAVSFKAEAEAESIWFLGLDDYSNPPESFLAKKQRKTVSFKAEAESIWVLGLDDYSEEEYKATFESSKELKLTLERVFRIAEQERNHGLDDNNNKRKRNTIRGLERIMYMDHTLNLRRQACSAVLRSEDLELYKMISRECLCEALWVAERDAAFARQYQSGKKERKKTSKDRHQIYIWPLRECSGKARGHVLKEEENEIEEEKRHLMKERMTGNNETAKLPKHSSSPHDVLLHGDALFLASPRPVLKKNIISPSPPPSTGSKTRLGLVPKTYPTQHTPLTKKNESNLVSMQDLNLGALQERRQLPPPPLVAEVTTSPNKTRGGRRQRRESAGKRRSSGTSKELPASQPKQPPPPILKRKEEISQPEAGGGGLSNLIPRSIEFPDPGSPLPVVESTTSENPCGRRRVLHSPAEKRKSFRSNAEEPHVEVGGLTPGVVSLRRRSKSPSWRKQPRASLSNPGLNSSDPPGAAQEPIQTGKEATISSPARKSPESPSWRRYLQSTLANPSEDNATNSQSNHQEPVPTGEESTMMSPARRRWSKSPGWRNQRRNSLPAPASNSVDSKADEPVPKGKKSSLLLSTKRNTSRSPSWRRLLQIRRLSLPDPK